MADYGEYGDFDDFDWAMEELAEELENEPLSQNIRSVVSQESADS